MRCKVSSQKPRKPSLPWRRMLDGLQPGPPALTRVRAGVGTDKVADGRYRRLARACLLHPVWDSWRKPPQRRPATGWHGDGSRAGCRREVPAPWACAGGRTDVPAARCDSPLCPCTETHEPAKRGVGTHRPGRASTQVIGRGQDSPRNRRAAGTSSRNERAAAQTDTPGERRKRGEQVTVTSYKTTSP